MSTKCHNDFINSPHTLMIKQLLGILALLIFVNSSSYIPGKTGCESKEHTTMLAAKGSVCQIYGRTLISTLMNRVFDLPIGAPKHKKTFFKYFLCFAMAYSVCFGIRGLVIYLKRILKDFRPKLSPLFKSKFNITPGYYSYLFRLSPF